MKEMKITFLCLILALLMVNVMAITNRETMRQYRTQQEQEKEQKKEHVRVVARDIVLANIDECYFQYNDYVRGTLDEIERQLRQTDKQIVETDMSRFQASCVAYCIRDLIQSDYVIEYDADNKKLTVDLLWVSGYHESSIRCKNKMTYYYNYLNPLFPDSLKEFLFSFLQESQDQNNKE